MTRLVYNEHEFPLISEGDLILGRHRENDIPLADGKASRRHARVFRKDDGTVWVEDLDSANGTMVNDEEISAPRQLVDGDQIVIGKAKIRFIGDAINSTSAHETRVVVDDPKQLLHKTVGGCRLDSIIGSGPQGTVFRGHQLSLGRAVAVKVFHETFLKRDPQFAERFMTEARQAGRVQHHNVVKIYECGQDEGFLWYCMELVEGETVEDLLARDGKLEPPLAMIMVEQIAHALKAAHDMGVYHGDVHPGTVMLSREGKIKLLDLGLVRILQARRSGSGTKRIVGNPWYMSPERAQGEIGDGRSDIYSLGCLAYHLLAGEPPFHDDSPKAILRAQLEQPIPNISEKISHIPNKVDEFIHSMLAKNPAWRFANMDEVLSDIAQVKAACSSLAKYAAPTQKKSHDDGSGDRSHAAKAQTNSEYPAPTAPKAEASRSRAVFWVSVCVIMGVAYLLSGISFTKLFEVKTTPSHHEGASLPASITPTTQVASPSNDAPASAINANNSAPVTPVAPAAPASSVMPHDVAWKKAQSDMAEQRSKNNWGAAELRLNRFAAEISAAPEAANYVALIQTKRDSLYVAGDAWYRQEIAQLPNADQAAHIAPRLARLSELRDKSLSRNREDAESRYQELVTKLDQQLRSAQRQARHAVEEGKAEQLEPIAKSLEPWFTGTPLVSMHRQFANLLNEAKAAQPWLPLSHQSGQISSEKIASGKQALAIGAALFVMGDNDRAKKLLLNHPALMSGELVRRREALFGRDAAILSFAEVADLQFIETLLGDVRLVDGVLTGVGQAACGFSVAVPVGGHNWQVSMQLTMPWHDARSSPAIGQIVVSLVKEEKADLTLRMDADNIALMVHSAKGWENYSLIRRADQCHLRFACRSGQLTIFINNEVVAEIPEARIVSGSHLHVECVDTAWTVDELHVVGE
jgi:serine/threonine protein kinase